MLEGDEVQVTATITRDGYLYFYDVGPDGKTSRLIPEEVWLKAGQIWKSPVLIFRLDDSQATVAAKTVRVIATKEPLPRTLTDPEDGGYLGILRLLTSSHDNWTQDDMSYTIYRNEKKPPRSEIAVTPPPAATPAFDQKAPETAHSSVDKPLYHNPDNPDYFAIIVGVEKYSNGLPDARFAQRDAEAVFAHLRALGYPERNIIFLKGAHAGRAGIEKYVESWLPRNVNPRPDSRVFIYFSGHGAPNTATGQAYLLPWDGDPKFLENTGYPLDRFYAKLNALKAKQVVVALDACFSGAGGRSVLPKGARPLVTKIDSGELGVGKLIVLAASAGDEITGSEESQGHGLFTYHLLKGLSDKDGDATIQDLYEQLLPNVQDAARRENREQTPQLLPADMGAKARLKLR